MNQARTHGEDGERRRGEQVASGTQIAAVIAGLRGRPIVLIGMMGAGKTTIGRRLANVLGRHFLDSDAEIESAAGMSIPDIFEVHGEGDFRAGEVRVIARLMAEKDIVLGTGGGAFINPETRDLIRSHGVSIWLSADLDTLFARVSRRANRPLLKTANPRQTLSELIEKRSPIYAEADLTINSRDVPHDVIVRDIIDALAAQFSKDIHD